MSRYALPLVGFAGLALSQLLYTCDGMTRPNWDHCDLLLDNLGWENSAEYVRNTDDNDECNPVCKMFRTGSGNCLFSVCMDSTSCMGVSHIVLQSGYNHVLREYCKPAESGGVYDPDTDNWELAVTNDPEYTGSQLLLASYATSNITHDNGVIEYTLQPEELSAVLEAAAESFPVEEKRQEEGDDFDLHAIEYSRIRPGHYEVASPILSSGAEYTWSFSETKTVSVGMSAEVGVSLFSIFTASAGIETSMDHSETIEEGLTFTVGDCPDEAVVHYYPLFDRYLGSWSSSGSGETWSAWIPVAQGDYVSGRFVTVCLGL